MHEFYRRCSYSKSSFATISRCRSYSIHTSSLELGNETPDKLINKISIEENRIVITKDSDFYNSFILSKVPYKIIFVKTGNISKANLINLFKNNLNTLLSLIQENSIIELDSSEIKISHR